MPVEKNSASYFLRHGLIVVGFNTVTGIGLALRNDDPVTHMVYSQAIGLCIWACIDFGRLLFKNRDPQSDWPVGWRRILLMGVGIVAGYTVGTLIGDLYCGCSTLDKFSRSLRVSLGYLFMALTVSTAIIYFFYSRGRGEQLEQLVATAQRDAAENQLKLLASQLEPHMLFNTLANLRVLIGIDPPRAQAMLDQLIGFLRSTLSGSRAALHPLHAEFARLADYLALMQVRMGSRLQSRFDLPAGLADAAVPPLLLQPLVENCIKHGLEPKVAGGRIELSAARDGTHLVLTVRDTGAGLSGAQGNGTQFGLEQVRERLASTYGAAASVVLRAADDGEGGAVAVVRLPLGTAV